MAALRDTVVTGLLLEIATCERCSVWRLSSHQQLQHERAPLKKRCRPIRISREWRRKRGVPEAFAAYAPDAHWFVRGEPVRGLKRSTTGWRKHPGAAEWAKRGWASVDGTMAVT
jgi:hypothetical protein